MSNRFGSFASARVAIPLGAALIAAVVLPAVLLRSHDSVILPFAAPAGSNSRIVHTQAEPKAARKHHATRHHVRPRRAVRSATPVFTARAAAAGHGPAVHPKHAKAEPKHAKAHPKHAAAKPKQVKKHKHQATPVQQAAPANTTAIATPTPATNPKPHHADHVEVKKAHPAKKVHPAKPEHGPTHAREHPPKAEDDAKQHGKGKP